MLGLCKKNVYQAFTIKDIENHPLYKELPEPEDIIIQSFKDLSRLKEGSVEWDLLHIGRLTTSNIAAVCGIYEPIIATCLKIPSFLFGSQKAERAYLRLKEPRLFENLKEAKIIFQEGLIPKTNSKLSKLVNHSKKPPINENLSSSTTKLDLLTPFLGSHNFATFRKDENDEKSTVSWLESSLNSTSSSSFPHEAKVKSNDLFDKNNFTDPLSAKTAWGNLQEATAILQVINYFSEIGSEVQQTGLLFSEALNFENLKKEDKSFEDKREQKKIINECHNLGLDFGATPDGLIFHKLTNEYEPLEIKNHSPFVRFKLSPKKKKKTRKEEECFLNLDIYRKLGSSTPLWYIPQIQLEIFNTGYECKSGILFRLTANDGGILIRYFRDDEFITMMLKQSKKFYQKYVLKNEKPNDNFIRGDLANRFIQKIREINRKAVVLKRFQQHEIQRHPNFKFKL